MVEYPPRQCSLNLRVMLRIDYEEGFHVDVFMLSFTVVLCVCIAVINVTKAATSVVDCIEKFNRTLKRRRRKKK